MAEFKAILDATTDYILLKSWRMRSCDSCTVLTAAHLSLINARARRNYIQTLLKIQW